MKEEAQNRIQPTVQTIEKTSKEYKLKYLVSTVFFATGIVLAGVGIYGVLSDRLGLVGVGLAAIPVLFVVALWRAFIRFKIWWHHG